jgi:hypothetical protein
MKNCERCGVIITNRNRVRCGRFCSRSCRDKANYWNKRERRLLHKMCLNCGINFQSIRNKQHCSEKCAKAKYQKDNRGDTYKASRELVYADKIAKGCSRCPERRPSCLQYHHLNPNEKVAGIGTLMQKAYPETVAAEMRKCIILCANCHFIEEHGDGYKDEDRPNVQKEYSIKRES